MLTVMDILWTCLRSLIRWLVILCIGLSFSPRGTSFSTMQLSELPRGLVLGFWTILHWAILLTSITIRWVVLRIGLLSRDLSILSWRKMLWHLSALCHQRPMIFWHQSTSRSSRSLGCSTYFSAELKLPPYLFFRIISWVRICMKESGFLQCLCIMMYLLMKKYQTRLRDLYSLLSKIRSEMLCKLTKGCFSVLTLCIGGFRERGKLVFSSTTATFPSFW